jgi:hypothetical protein
MMTSLDIAHQRLHNQRIADAPFEKPADVVQWLGAVQAQDYAAAKWALGLRMQGATDESIEQAFADGTILRTHVMRPTWHFVTPADIRWMLTLTAPRVNAFNAYYYRKLALDDAVFLRNHAVLAKALQGGKQFTYALLEERAPQARTLERDEALAELTRRYFTSHGPATLQDFVWWSGLTVLDVKAGLEMVRSQLVHEIVDGQAYWFSMSMPTAKDLSSTAYLLPNYDEYIVGYTDRSASFDTRHAKKLDARGNILFNHMMVINGQIAGTWKRTLKKNTVVIEANPFTPLSKAETRAFVASANRYGAFLHRSVNATFQVG